jgi:hypothetical protein
MEKKIGFPLLMQSEVSPYHVAILNGACVAGADMMTGTGA